MPKARWPGISELVRNAKPLWSQLGTLWRCLRRPRPVDQPASAAFRLFGTLPTVNPTMPP